MSRPQKQKSLKHNRCIMVRLTDAEYELICQNANKSGYSPAVYARKKLINEPICIKYDIVADTPELKKLTSEFGNISNNLNQIAKFFNMGGLRSKQMQDEIHKCISEVFSLRKEVLKMAGDFNGNTKAYRK